MGKAKRPRDGNADENRPKKKMRVAREVDESLLDEKHGVNKAFQLMDSQLLADYLAQKTSRFGKDLTVVELADLSISAAAIKDTTSWPKTRTLENLPDFLRHFADDPSKLNKASSQNGAPHTIIVAGAGLRAANLVRSMREFQGKDNTVAKLFAKHIKLEEAVQFLKNRRTGIAVGTPARLMALLDSGALSVVSLRRIIVDASHIDQKKRGVMDMRETAIPLAQWLGRKEFKERYGTSEKPLDLLFY